MKFQRCLCILGLALLALCLASSAGAQVTITDSVGKKLTLTDKPSRVVSLVPQTTEAIYAIGAGAALVGHTYHTLTPAGNPPPAIVGGVFAPSLAAIIKRKPQLVFVGGPHQGLIEPLTKHGIQVITLQARSLAEVGTNLRALGKIFGRQDQASLLCDQIADELKLIAQKSARIPKDHRRRATRVMSFSPDGKYVYVPGKDTFQQDFVRAAGAIPPQVGAKKHVVKMDLAQWQAFNPQAVYVCGGRKRFMAMLKRPGWNQVEAVNKWRIFNYPCPLTCQASLHSGKFVQWLAADIYSDLYAQKSYWIKPNGVINRKDVALNLDCVAKAQVIEERIMDFTNRTLLISFKQPTSVMSTLEGQRTGITAAGNHYFPPPSWRLGHGEGLPGLRKRILSILGRGHGDTSLLFTGADMKNLSVQMASEKGLTAYALVTAGVLSNALRSSKDKGSYVEPGTINILILTNRQLTQRAMGRAVLTATEAKTAALQDLDVRSSEQPLIAQATGTGTDNVLVVSGQGASAHLTGGHSKLGELIARAVYQGVTEAVLKQNRLRPGRNVLQRLRERKLSPYGIAGYQGGTCPAGGVQAGYLEEALLDPRYASLVESALALSDAQQRGLLAGLKSFKANCERVSLQLAGKNKLAPPYKLGTPDLPQPLAMALGAVLRGLASQPRPLIPVSDSGCGE